MYIEKGQSYQRESSPGLSGAIVSLRMHTSQKKKKTLLLLVYYPMIIAIICFWTFLRC